MSRIAVLTGDIVESSALSTAALDETIAALGAGVADISAWERGVATGFARQAGDGWQAVLDDGRLAVRAALYLQACVRRLAADRATRIAVALGDGDLSPADRENPNSATGPAFTASGRLLDGIGRHALMAHAGGGAVAAALRLADHIAQQWTQAQARALCEMLVPEAGPRSEAAERLGISRQAVDQALWGAGYPALTEALELLEAE
ncbi:MarR family transcriptional regulator [Psychromarinibacter sp. C21-152]|uniref:MarR family transcriptional regulator n=1 Tax=Psychromarinibacter sediminicola TaxID=3033385 RepID=A0AAE3NSY0_9RHOB|nr:MarR family transcriptional regulator [Psychromarinibacter sediminicola]MDF0602953.1 MarR family transcriptional regulator [Psychromarinibacter sediminicola]